MVGRICWRPKRASFNALNVLNEVPDETGLIRKGMLHRCWKSQWQTFLLVDAFCWRFQSRQGRARAHVSWPPESRECCEGAAEAPVCDSSAALVAWKKIYKGLQNVSWIFFIHIQTFHSQYMQILFSCPWSYSLVEWGQIIPIDDPLCRGPMQKLFLPLQWNNIITHLQLHIL